MCFDVFGNKLHNNYEELTGVRIGINHITQLRFRLKKVNLTLITKLRFIRRIIMIFIVGKLQKLCSSNYVVHLSNLNNRNIMCYTAKINTDLFKFQLSRMPK